MLHEEASNQFPGMAYYRDMFSGEKLTMRAIDFGSDHPFSMRATLDALDHWRLSRFLPFLIVHLVILCFKRCFRNK